MHIHTVRALISTISAHFVSFHFVLSGIYKRSIKDIHCRIDELPVETLPGQD